MHGRLNTHAISSLYKVFPATKAREMTKRLAIHYATKHGICLNIAEIAINVLSKQCIDRRIFSLEMLNKEIVARDNDSNATKKKIDWQFTTEAARIKLRKLYTVFIQ